MRSCSIIQPTPHMRCKTHPARHTSHVTRHTSHARCITRALAADFTPSPGARASSGAGRPPPTPPSPHLTESAAAAAAAAAALRGGVAWQAESSSPGRGVSWSTAAAGRPHLRLVDLREQQPQNALLVDNRQLCTSHVTRHTSHVTRHLICPAQLCDVDPVPPVVGGGPLRRR